MLAYIFVKTANYFSMVNADYNLAGHTCVYLKCDCDYIAMHIIG